jgi:hypothetical protein
MHSVTRSFLELPAEAKAHSVSPDSGRGFVDGGFIAASFGKQTPPDLCESFSASHLGEPGGADPVHFGEAALGVERPERVAG